MSLFLELSLLGGWQDRIVKVLSRFIIEKQFESTLVFVLFMVYVGGLLLIVVPEDSLVRLNSAYGAK